MTKQETKVIQGLRNKGYAVIAWFPEELQGADPKYVEEGSIEAGYRILESLAESNEEIED
jgi:hypothetical protein